MSVPFMIDAESWSRVEQLLPRGRRGAHRVDDHRALSGIVFMLRSGGRWRDCPREYGPYTTIYNRFDRWSKQGIWLAMYDALKSSAALDGMASIDSTAVKAHRSAGGGKGGRLSERLAGAGVDEPPKSTP